MKIQSRPCRSLSSKGASTQYENHRKPKSARSLRAELAARPPTPMPGTPEMSPCEYAEPCTPQPPSPVAPPCNFQSYEQYSNCEVPSIPVTHYKEPPKMTPFEFNPVTKQALGLIFQCCLCRRRVGSYNCSACGANHVVCLQCSHNRPYCMACALEYTDRIYSHQEKCAREKK